MEIALTRNPATRQAWQNAKAAAAAKRITDSAYFPTITIGAIANRNSAGTATGASHIITDYYAPTLQITYMLFNFGGRRANSRAAEEAIYAANFNYNRILQEVVLATAQSYYNLAAAEASVDSASFNVKDAKTVFETASIRLDSGLGTTQDVLRAEANLREAEFILQSNLAQVETARAILSQNLGAAVSGAIDIPEIRPPDDLNTVETNVARLTADALAARPDLMAAYANIASREASLKAARSSLWPQLVVQFNGNLTTVRDRASNPTEDWTAGFGLTWEIFDGFRKRNQIALAQTDVAAARETFRQSYYQVVADVWSAFYSLEAAKGQTVAARAQVQAATAALELTQLGYENGLNTLLELVESQNDLASARLQKIQAETNFLTSLARIANAVGRTELTRTQSLGGTPNVTR